MVSELLMTFEKSRIELFTKLENATIPYPVVLRTYIKINGITFHPEFVLDVRALARSCQFSGELDIFTCSCDMPLCAGIEDGINVEHLNGDVIWKFYEPISNKNHDELNDEEWEAIKVHYELQFDLEHYCSNISLGIHKLKAMVSDSDLPALSIHGFTEDQLFRL